MTVKKIMKSVHLDGTWTKVDLGKETDFYMIAKKNAKKKKSDTIESTLIQRVRFEVGVASGIKNKPLTISYITLNFNDVTSTDLEINNITAMAKHTKFPSVFYIKPIEFWDGKNIIKEGKTSMDITVTALALE